MRHFRVRALRQLLLLVAPAVAAGCLGGRRPATPRAAPTTPDAGAAKPRLDSARLAGVVDAAKAARDSLAADSAKRAAAAPDSAARRDSTAKPIAVKAPVKATKRCIFDTQDSPPETRVRYQRLPDSTGLMFLGGGVVGHCQGEKNKVRADSAEQYEASGIVNLFGNVVYEEPGRLRFEAQHATYFTKEERLFADGNVVATQLESGSTFRGPSMEYLRPIPGSRPTSRLIAPNRPTAQILEKDSTGKPGPPVNISANTMVDEGDSVLFAWGDVQINRTTLVGEADSASFDKLTERARLIRTARIVNRDKDEPFRLFGDTIDIYSKDRKVERVIALHNANSSSNDVVMMAEKIDLRFAEQKLDRAFAFGKGRAKATTSAQLLEADSIAIRMPNQKIRQVVAVGRAVATGTPDTLKIKSDDRDVLRGDTVKAWFDSTETPDDTTSKARISEIHAMGNASSLFQIASKQGPTAPASLNYVRGMTILVVFDSGQVRFVTVDSAATGLYQEPAPDSLSDSTKGRGAVPPRPKVPPAAEGPGQSTGFRRPDPVILPDSRRRS
jgi:lipopolysaccharide export system protein LptA